MNDEMMKPLLSDVSSSSITYMILHHLIYPVSALLESSDFYRQPLHLVPQHTCRLEAVTARGRPVCTRGRLEPRLWYTP